MWPGTLRYGTEQPISSLQSPADCSPYFVLSCPVLPCPVQQPLVNTKYSTVYTTLAPCRAGLLP